MLLKSAIILSIILLAPICQAVENPPPMDQKAMESYSLGYEFGSNMKREAMDVDIKALLDAIQDAVTGKAPRLTPEEMHSIKRQLRQKLMVQQIRRKEDLSARNLEEGMAFLAANQLKEGVKVLSSGLQYKVLKEGSGQSPAATDKVMVRYRGTLVDGTEFDNSDSRGEAATLLVSGVIRGWTEALQLMKVGAKWQLFVPPELAYGGRQFGRIPPNSALIFELELLSIVPSANPDTIRQ